MKQRIGIVVFLSVFLVINFTIKTNAEISDNNLYINEEYGFQINFPLGWELKDGSGIHAIKKAIDGKGTSITVFVYDIYQEAFTNDQRASLNRKDMDFSEYSDKEIEEFLDDYYAKTESQYSNVHLLKKCIRYVDNKRTGYFKYSFTYKTEDRVFDMTISNYLVLKNGYLFLFGGGALSSAFIEKEPIIDETCSTFRIIGGKEEVSENIPVDENLGTLASLFMASLVVGIILTWGIGILFPLFLRYLIYKKPLSKSIAIIIAVTQFVLQLVLAMFMGSQSKTHFSLLIIAWISYSILTRGNNERNRKGETISNDNSLLDR